MGQADRDDEAARARERATIAALFASADSLRDAAIARAQCPPRFILEAAKTMARHLGMPDRRRQELVPSMAFWQAYLASALARNPAIFAEARSRFPSSYEVVRSAVAEMGSHRQVVFVVFHMAAMPLIAAFLALAVTEIHGRRGHVLLSPQNAARLQVESGRWVLDVSNVISADAAGLRRLVSGLRAGTITRLLVLPDGPQRPAGAGTRMLTKISSTVAFKTGLLSRILAMGIPMRPLTHKWEEDALALRWHPFLDQAGASGGTATDDAISRVASLIEELLECHPEQWLNWSAASLRA